VDFEGFAKRAEQLGTPVRLIEWLDETMQAFTKVILKENGAILKYMGDSIMVAFGAPLYRSTEEEHATDARQSVQCALALRGKLVQLNGEWTRRGEPTLRMRIGICTGEVGAGTIGSGNRLEYTVLGDTTNTASRLENCMKERMGTEVAVDNCRIFISGSTNRYCAEFFDTRYIGEVDVRKPTPVHVYAVMDAKLRGGAPALSEAGVRPQVQQQAPSES
jgi:class 3 adenylate cyclase